MKRKPFIVHGKEYRSPVAYYKFLHRQKKKPKKDYPKNYWLRSIPTNSSCAGEWILHASQDLSGINIYHSVIITTII